MVHIFVKCMVKYGFRGAADLAREEFVVPSQLICSKSSYFQSLFEGGFQESQSGQARLYDVRPWVFRVFISWLYHRAIYYVPERTEPTKFCHTEQTDTPKLSSPNKYNCACGIDVVCSGQVGHERPCHPAKSDTADGCASCDKRFSDGLDGCSPRRGGTRPGGKQAGLEDCQTCTKR